MNAEQEIVSAIAAFGLRDRPSGYGVASVQSGTGSREPSRFQTGQAARLGWGATENPVPDRVPSVWPDRPRIARHRQRTPKAIVAVRVVVIAVASLFGGAAISGLVHGAMTASPVVVHMLWQL